MVARHDLRVDFFFFFQAEDGIRDRDVTGVQTCALPISSPTRIGRCWRTRGRAVAGACRNRTYRGSFEPQLVLKTSPSTSPKPPPRLSPIDLRRSPPRPSPRRSTDRPDRYQVA